MCAFFRVGGSRLALPNAGAGLPTFHPLVLACSGLGCKVGLRFAYRAACLNGLSCWVRAHACCDSQTAEHSVGSDDSTRHPALAASGSVPGVRRRMGLLKEINS